MSNVRRSPRYAIAPVSFTPTIASPGTDAFTHSPSFTCC